MDVAALCVASTEGDAKAVRKLLITNSASLPAEQAPTGPDDPLLPSPAECRSLHDLLFGSAGASRATKDVGAESGGIGEELSAGAKRKRPFSTSSCADEAKWGESTAAAVAESSPSSMQLPAKEEDIVALIRALLMIPGTTYATPWEAAVCAVSAVQTKSGVFGQQLSEVVGLQAHVEGKMTMVEAVVAEIGIFLGTVGYYPRRRTTEKMDRSNGDTAGGDERTQSALLNYLANLIVAPLILERDDDEEDDDAGQGESAKGQGVHRAGIAAALGLLPALFGAAKRMDRNRSVGGKGAGSDLIASVLDRLVPPESSGTANLSNSAVGGNDDNSKKGLKSSVVALLLPTLVSLGPHISQQRWLDARALITGALMDIPCADLPALATNLVDQVISRKTRERPTQVRTNESGEAASSTAEAKSPSSSWCILLLRLYQHAADADSSKFGAAYQATNTAATSSIVFSTELALSKTFATMSSANLIRLADAIKDAATQSDEADTGTLRWVASNIILLIGATSRPNECNTARIMADQAILGNTCVSSSGRRRRRGSSVTPVSSYALDILVENMLVGDKEQNQRLTLSDLRSHLTRPNTKRNRVACEKLIQRLEAFVAQAIFLGGRLCCKSRGRCLDDVIEAHVRRYLNFANGILTQFDSDAQSVLAEQKVIPRICFALVVYTVAFEGVPGLRQDILLNLTRELCSDDSGRRTMHYDLALLALGFKAQGDNEREVADEESIDTDAAASVSECFDGLVDMLSRRRTVGKDTSSEDACHNLEPLSTHAIRTVAQALCPVSSKGRQAIFDVATQLLSSLTKSTDELSSHFISVAPNPDAAPLAIDLLCLLLRPTGGFARDSYFSSSLAKLCNMMVLDAPPLDLAARQALYSHLNNFAKEEELDAWTCARLERAAICALLKYFGSISKPSGGRDNCNEICTMRLVFLPERSFTSWSRLDGESSRRRFHVTQIDDISMLLELILALRASRLCDHRNLSQTLVKVIGEGSLSDMLDCSATAVEPSTHGSSSEEVGNLIDQVLSHCLGAVAQTIFSSESPVDQSFGGCVWKPCRLLQKRIVVSSEETAIFDTAETEQATTRTATKEPLCPPKWLEYDESQAFWVTNIDREIVLDSIVSSLCSTIFCIVLGGGSRTDDDTEHALSLAIAFNKIIQKTSAVRERNEEAASVLIDDLSTNLIEHAHPYLEASTLALRRLLTAKSTNDGSSSNEKRLYVVLKGLERCCHCIENIDSYYLSQDFNAKQTASSLWKIYLEVGGEDGACRLIRYLDERLMRAKGVGVPDLAIESHEDIDELVRSVRIAILTSLASLVKYSQRLLGQNNPTSLDELLGKISSLCSDLCTGLDGKSGGITRNVFMAYLTAIDTCIDSILFMDHELIWQELSSGATDLPRAQVLIEASSIYLWNIPCKFCLDQEARTFKATLDMALSGLQSVRRHLDFALLHVGQTSITSSNVNASGPRNACHSLSDASMQCVVALRKGSAVSKGRKHSSKKVIDDDSSSDDSSSSTDDDASSTSNEYESDHNIGGTLKSSGDGPTSKKAFPGLPKALRRLQLNTSNAWTWTQTAVFLAVETNWAESQSIIKAKNLNVRKLSSPMLAAYIARRQQELSSALICTTSFLETAQHAPSSNHGREDGLSPNRQDGSDEEEHEFDDKKEQVNDTLLSEMLSSTTKLKLSSTLDRVTTTLRAALRIILMMLKDGKDGKYEGKGTEDALNLQNSIPFGESLACFCAWFTCCRKSRALLTSGTRRWFHSEKARYRVAKAKAKAGGYHLDQDPILSRLPKVLYQMEELEVSFQKLAAIVSAPLSKFLQSFHANVDALLPCSAESTNSFDCTESKSFAALVAEHRDRLASSSDSKLSSFDMALISFKDKEDGNPTLGKRKRRGRSTAIEKHLRKAQRNVLRSRNEVVDEWLDLDADNDDRNDSMDAFVDLEDFLVEG